MTKEASQGSNGQVLLRSTAARSHCLNTGRAVEQFGILVATDDVDTVGRSMIEVGNGAEPTADLSAAYDEVAASMERKPVLSHQILELMAEAVNAQYPPETEAVAA